MQIYRFTKLQLAGGTSAFLGVHLKYENNASKGILVTVGLSQSQEDRSSALTEREGNPLSLVNTNLPTHDTQVTGMILGTLAELWSR